MQPEKTNQHQPQRRSLYIIIGLLLFMLSRTWISGLITDRKDKNLFNLVAITLMMVFVFIVCYRKTRAGEYIKYRPLLYIGILVWLVFITYFLYVQFATPV